MSHTTLNNVISFTERNSFHHNLNTFPISLPTSVLLSDPLSSFVLPLILPKPSIHNFSYLLPNSQPLPEDESSSECNLSVIEKCRLPNHQLLPEDSSNSNEECEEYHWNNENVEINVEESESNKINMSLDNYQPSPYVILDRTLWESLYLLCCQKCKYSPLQLVNTKTESLYEELHFQCPSCNSKQIVSNSPLKKISMTSKTNGIRPINLQTNLASNLSGQTFVNFEHFTNEIGLNSISKTGFFRMSKRVWKEARKVAKEGFEEIKQLLISDQMTIGS